MEVNSVQRSEFYDLYSCASVFTVKTLIIKSC